MVNLDESVSHGSLLLQPGEDWDECTMGQKPLGPAWARSARDLRGASQTRGREKRHDCRAPKRPPADAGSTMLASFAKFLRRMITALLGGLNSWRQI